MEDHFEIEIPEITDEEVEELKRKSSFIKRIMVDGALVEYWITPGGQLLVCPAKAPARPPLTDWLKAGALLAISGGLVWVGAWLIGWV